MAGDTFSDAADWLDEEIGYDVQELAMLCLGEFVDRSPVDEGRLRSNWIVTVDKETSRVRSEIVNNPASLGRAVIKRAIKRASDFEFIMIQNNLSYSSVIDDGLYANPPKKGTFLGKGKGYEIRSIGGFSKQAPNGITAPGIQSALQRAKGR